MTTQTWGDNVLAQSFQNLWGGIVDYVPRLIVAIIILIIGWVIAAFICKVVEQIFRSLKIDNLLRGAGVEDLLNKGGLKLNSGLFIGKLVEWFIILAFLIASFDVLRLREVTAFLREITFDVVPHVIVAALILMAAVVIAEFVQKVVLASARAAQIKSAHFVAGVTKWAIWIFAIIGALLQIGVARDVLLVIVQGIIMALSLALGLAFGLGGQDAAARYIEKLRGDISSGR